MHLRGVATYKSRKDGVKKDNTPWYVLRMLDDDADEFFGIFVDEDTYENFANISKHTSVKLTIDLIAGKKYFSLVDYEIFK